MTERLRKISRRTSWGLFVAGLAGIGFKTTVDTIHLQHMNPEQVKVQALQQRREGLAFDLWGFEQVCGYAALAGVIGGIATMKRLREYPVSAPAAITATELPEVTHSVSVAATASRAAAVATAEDLRNVTFLPGAVAQPA